MRIASSTSQGPGELLSGLGTPWNTLRVEGRLAAEPMRGVSLFTRARLDSEDFDIARAEAGANVSSKGGFGEVRRPGAGACR